MSATITNMPAFSGPAALNMLWQKAVPKLKAHELQWLIQGIPDQIESENESLAFMLTCISHELSVDDPIDLFRNQHDLPGLLFSLCRHLENTNVMLKIASDASYLFRKANEGDKS